MMLGDAKDDIRFATARLGALEDFAGVPRVTEGNSSIGSHRTAKKMVHGRMMAGTASPPARSVPCRETTKPRGAILKICWRYFAWTWVRSRPVSGCWAKSSLSLRAASKRNTPSRRSFKGPGQLAWRSGAASISRQQMNTTDLNFELVIPRIERKNTELRSREIDYRLFSRRLLFLLGSDSWLSDSERLQ